VSGKSKFSVLVTALVVWAGGAWAQAGGERFAPGRVLAQAKAGLAPADVERALRGAGGKGRRIGASNLYIVDVPRGSERAVAALLAHNPHFKFAELDQAVAPDLAVSDPYAGSQWHLSKIAATTAWESSQGSGVTIAILDSGIDASHPDLSSRLVSGWNFYDNNSDTSDVYGHGTKVAGAAAAITNNGTGVASVAGQAKIMPIRITDTSGYGYWSTMAQGLTYAADRGVRVANISFGSSASATVQSAAQYMKDRGGLVFVAAGNQGTLLTAAPTTSLITVGATDGNDAKTSWSNYGDIVALAAPGSSIYSTVKGGSYSAVSGTSFAAPVAAGVAALIMSAKPGLSSADVEKLLFSTAVDLGSPGRDVYFGHGRVDAAAAVKAALGTSTTITADTQAPTVAIASPAGGSSVSGLATVDVSAKDNVGVAKVELRVNGSLYASDTSAPFSFSWDTKKVANGTATLEARAYDAAGNAASSAKVSVNVFNTTTTTADTTPPVVTISNPKDKSFVKNNVSISVAASDNAGASGITQTLFIDGVQVAKATGGSLSYTWNSRKAAVGAHTVKAVAKDAAGNTSSTSITLYRY
jgi:thermitase